MMSVKVYDNKTTADRYTVVINDHFVFAMSDNACSPNGFNHFSGYAKEFDFTDKATIGSEANLRELPVDVLCGIITRLTSNLD